MNYINKYADIKLLYPFLFVISKINVNFIIIAMPLLFIYGNWVLTGSYIFLLAIFMLFEKIKYFKKIQFYFKLLFFLISLAGINAITRSSDLPEGVMYFVATIFIPFLIFMVITNSDLTFRNINHFLNVNIISGAVLGLFSIYIVVILGSPGARISSVWEDFNIVAAYFMIVLFIIITNIIHNEDKKVLLLNLLALIPVLLGLFFTQTRGVWLSVIIALLFYILKRPKALIPALVLFTLVMMFFYSIVMDRFLSVKNFGTDMSSLGRIQAWIASILLIKDHWLFGAGFDSFMDLKYTVFDYYLVDVPHSHNTYLRLILEMGIIGFIPYISVMIISFIFTFKLIKVNKTIKSKLKIVEALQLSFIGLFSAFMFEPYLSLYGNSTIIIWCLISISVYLYKKELLKA